METGALCRLHQVPRHLQFNRDVLTGYRPPMSARECVASCLYLHNESFNVYSHCIGFLYFILACSDYITVWPATPGAVTVFIAVDLCCCLLPFILSVVYHTFMPLWGSEFVYKKLLKLDVLGVWIVCTFGPLSYMYTGLYCRPLLQQTFLLCYMIVSLVVLVYLMLVDCKRQRVTALTVQYGVRVLTHPFRLSSLSQVATLSVKYYLVMDAISAVGALINAYHIPERWLPGKLDYVCNGHTLMHVAAVLGLAVCRRGFLCDMAWLNDGRVCA